MIYLDENADTILPYGLKGTPFETVFKALQSAAASVWAVDPSIYRAGIAWMYYATTAPDALAYISRDLLSAALISEAAPLVKDTQTPAELVGLLAAWREYIPTYTRLEAVYQFYAATVEVLPITDPESQDVLPVAPGKNLQFYVKIVDTDWSRPLLLSEAVTIGVNATPIGAQVYAYYGFESRIDVFADFPYGDAVIQYVDDELCVPVLLRGDYGVMTADGDEDPGEVLWGEEVPDHQGLRGCGMQDGETPPYGEIEMAVEAVAYLRASAYQHLNKSVTANSSNVLYESGADAGLSVDETKTYTLLGAYTNGDVSVDITGASLTLLASGGLYYLRLVWGPNAASVCYIKYSMS